jgi:hypothetical protein
METMLQAVAIRDLQIAILPAATYVSQMHGALPTVCEQLRVYAARNVPSNPTDFDMNPSAQDHDSQETQYLNADLEPSSIVEVTERVQRDHHIFHQIRSAIELFLKTSQAVRKLTIFLAVEPTRGWVYDHLGDEGVNPIPTLAHCAEAMDAFLSAAFLVPNLADGSKFRARFYASPDHPLYGPITATRHELVKEKSTTLGTTFYKEHVLDHFRLRHWEWKIVQATLAILDNMPGNTSFLAKDAILQHWLFGYVKIPQPDKSSTASSARAIFEETKPRAFSSFSLLLTIAFGPVVERLAAYLPGEDSVSIGLHFLRPH